MSKKKKKWVKPKLIVLVRGRPEEMVLVVCKAGVWGGGPGEPWSTCSDRACNDAWDPCSTVTPT